MNVPMRTDELNASSVRGQWEKLNNQRQLVGTVYDESTLLRCLLHARLDHQRPQHLNQEGGTTQGHRLSSEQLYCRMSQANSLHSSSRKTR